MILKHIHFQNLKSIRSKFWDITTVITILFLFVNVILL